MHRTPGADSIMGVALFREESPAGFGAFDRGLSRSARRERHRETETGRYRKTDRQTEVLSLCKKELESRSERESLCTEDRHRQRYRVREGETGVRDRDETETETESVA